MSQPRSAFPRALASLIDIHLDDGAAIDHVVLCLRLQLAVLDPLDQRRRYLPELMQPHDPAGMRARLAEMLAEGGAHAQFR